MVEELPDGVEDDGAAEHRVGTVGVGAERLEELHGELGLLERGVFLVEEEEAFGELHADDGVERFGLRGLKKERIEGTVPGCWRELPRRHRSCGGRSDGRR